MKLYYIGLSIINIIIAFAFFQILRKDKTIIAKSRKAFYIAIFILLIAIIAEMITDGLAGSVTAWRFPYLVGQIVTFSVLPVFPLLLGLGLCELRPPLLRLLMLPAAVNVVLAVLSPFFGFVFSVAENNISSPGPLFPAFIIAYVSGIFFLFFKTVKALRYYRHGHNYWVSLSFIIMVVGPSVQLLFPSVHLTWLSATFALIAYYIFYIGMSRQLDALTALFNEEHYQKHLSEIDGVSDATILVFGIADLENLSERYGRSFSDFCLVETASCTKDAFSYKGACYRTAANRFCVISRQTDATAIRVSLRYFYDKLEKIRKKEPHFPKVSAGYALYTPSQNSLTQILSLAEQRMHNAE